MKKPRTHLTPFSRIKHVHFVGIGGAGMGGIAEVLLNQGFTVTGSDLSQNDMVKRLTKLGVTIYPTHDAQNILGADAVVRSTAIANKNPEIQAAIDNHIPVVPRAMMLGELMRFRNGIAIAGTHGKTTTTSLVTSIFAEAGLDPTFVIGGLLNSTGSNARLGQGDYLIAEADESDASFLYLHPMMTVVTNIDADHMETYHNNFDELKKTFIDFIHHLPFYGLAVLCNDDPIVKEILPKIARPFKTYGFDENATCYAKNINQVGTQNYFEVHRPNKTPLDIILNLAGEHNVLNALAAIVIATEAGIEDKHIQTALKNFGGVGRRLQVLGEFSTAQGNILLIDDYGHHPREITATLSAIRKAWPERRVVMAYQPHRYTRTRDLFNDFANVLSTADQLLLFDVYSAGESHIEGADSQSLINFIHQHHHNNAILISPKESFPTVLKTTLKNNDILLMQGAGDISSIANTLANVQLQF